MVRERIGGYRWIAQWAAFAALGAIVVSACQTDDAGSGTPAATPGGAGEGGAGASVNAAAGSTMVASSVGGATGGDAAGLGGKGAEAAATTGGQGGVGTGSDSHAAGASGAGAAGEPAVACPHDRIFGSHRLKLHSEVSVCDTVDATNGCAVQRAEDGTATLNIYKARDDASQWYGSVSSAMVTLGPKGMGLEEWDGSITVALPEVPGVDIWKTATPDSNSALWRLESDNDVTFCPGEFVNGGDVHVDIDSTTGHVVNFWQLCQDPSGDGTTHYYKVTGAGAEECDVDACNMLTNNAPPATVTYTRPETNNSPVAVLHGAGQLTSGIYFLKSVDLPKAQDCLQEAPVPITETLAITATTATTGEIAWASKRATFDTTRSTFQYAVVTDNFGTGLRAKYLCGDESVGELDSLNHNLSSVGFDASPTELRLEYYLPWCQGGTKQSTSVYSYEKQ